MNETPKPTVREIRTHIVNPANDKLKLTVIDAPGSGGAHHVYMIGGIDFEQNAGSKDIHARYDETPMKDREFPILFQNGPIPEHGTNGVTHEVLLAIVIDRLECFQKGPYASDDNSAALTYVRAAMQSLQNRTRKRMARGVEGTMEK